jgi:hypothetical protein
MVVVGDDMINTCFVVKRVIFLYRIFNLSILLIFQAFLQKKMWVDGIYIGEMGKTYTRHFYAFGEYIQG